MAAFEAVAPRYLHRDKKTLLQVCGCYDGVMHDWNGAEDAEDLRRY